MKLSRSMAFTLVCLSGAAMGANGGDVGVGQVDYGEVVDGGEICFNVATGERLLSVPRTGGFVEVAVWEQGDIDPCDFGDDSSYPGMVYYSSDPSVPELLGTMLLDWGDIAPDTRVDAVQLNYISQHRDQDFDGDGVGDGDHWLGARWTFYDALNGSDENYEQRMLPLVSFSFFGLPGVIEGDLPILYSFSVDLGSNFDDFLLFEIGDTDSDGQGASYFNANLDERETVPGVSDLDPDGDGLADWGWSVEFFQPGTVDWDDADGDGDPTTGVDGDPLDAAPVGVLVGVPTGGVGVYDNEDQRWSWENQHGRTEDLFHHADPVLYSSVSGPMNFGGFNCSGGLEGAVSFGGFSIGMSVVQEQESCLADVAGSADGSPDGCLNFTDLSAFLSYIAEGDLRADITGPVPCVPDGRVNFFDISKFVEYFTTLCNGY